MKTNVLVGLLFILAGPAWSAGSCAYREGLMALEQGQEIRARVMLTIAAREGDRHAQRLLLEHFGERWMAGIPRRLTDRVVGRRVDLAK